MKIEAKSLNKKTSVGEMCGSITFKAENEVDAVQLAALYNGWIHAEKGRVRQLREEALARYCRENNVTIKIERAA
jgi:hypothetical protein